MKNWKPILGILLVFALGILTGLFIAGAIARHGVDRISAEGPHFIGQLVVRRMTGNLDLTPDQKTKIQTIIGQTRTEISAIRLEAAPKVRQSLETAYKEIRAILTPEQAEKFDKNVERGRERWKRFQEK